MGLFDGLKKKEIKKAAVDRKYIFETEYPLDKSSWFEVFSACLGPAIIIQNTCAELVVKNRNWNVDFGRGILAFGEDVYPVQFLGSESNNDDSWMWGWNNINGFDESILTFANEVHSIGESWGLEALTVPVFDMNENYNGHTLAIVACGVTKNKYGYYRGPHDNGAILMGFSGVPEEVFAPVDLQRFCSAVVDCLQTFCMDHKIFIESLLMWNGTSYDWEDNKIIAHFEQDLQVSFEEVDEMLRISGLETV